jgi:hypothetical protein
MIAALSFIIWGTIIALAHAAITAISPIGGCWLHSAAAAVAGSLAFAVPISGIANTGPFEAAFAGALTALGAKLEPALASAVVVHLAAIVGNVISVMLGFAAFPVTAVRCVLRR